MPATETDAMHIAFEALRGQKTEVENRVIVWLMNRLREDRRTREVAAYAGPEPTAWEFHYPDEGEVGNYETRDEGMAEFDASAWDIVEIIALAAVHQEFIVAVPTDEGIIVETFKTRAEAEAYVATMTAEAKGE